MADDVLVVAVFVYILMKMTTTTCDKKHTIFTDIAD